MKQIATSLPGVLELRPKVFRDRRGFFLETYHQARFASLGIADLFAQDNHSCSSRGTLRGLHYQLRHPQAKLCRVVEGEALDIAVDIRVCSPQLGEWTSVRLSTKEQNQIYALAGFAHSFLAPPDAVQLLYRCSDFYDSSDEYGIPWSDPDLNILWRITDPIVSGRDASCPKLAQIPEEFLPEYVEK
jgi:dTDP-4-dehydrorhamnose 3,5-epimerase